MKDICARLHSCSRRSPHKFYLLFPFLAAKIHMKASCLHVLGKLLCCLLNFGFITPWLNILITFFYHIANSPFLLSICNAPTNQPTKQKVITFLWMKKFWAKRKNFQSLFRSDQNNSDSLLFILVFTYYIGDLALSIKLLHSIAILSIFSYWNQFEPPEPRGVPMVKGQ